MISIDTTATMATRENNATAYLPGDFACGSPGAASLRGSNLRKSRLRADSCSVWGICSSRLSR